MKVSTWLLVLLLLSGCVVFSAQQPSFPTQRMFGKKIRSRNLLDESIFIGKALDIGFTSPTIHPFKNNNEFVHASQTDSYGFSLFEYKHSEESLKRRRNPHEILKEEDYMTVSQSGQAIIHGSHHIYSLYGKVISGVSMLDHDVNVWDVKCSDNQLDIDFANGHSTSKRLIPGSRLVIGKQWQCYGQDTDTKYGNENIQAFLVLAREIRYGEDNMVRVKFHVKKIMPKDLFYDLKVDYYSVPLVRNMVDSNTLQISEPTNKRYSTTYRLFNTGFNYDIAEQKVKNPSIGLYKYVNGTTSFTIDCLDCFATVNLEIKAEIELGWWKVSSAKILVGGQTLANATLLFSYQASYSKTKEGTLYKLPAPIKISLFYLFSLDITPSLEYKLNIEASGKIEYRRNFLVSYSKYVGYKYESGTGFSDINEGDGLVWSSKSPGIFMEGNATAELAVYPKFKFELTSWLPSAEVAIIPTIKGQIHTEGTVSRSSASLFVKFDAFYKLGLSIDVKDTFSKSFEVITYTHIPSISGTYSLQTTFFSATASNSTVSANNPIPVNYINETVITGSTTNTIEFSSTPKNSVLISKRTIFKHLRNILNTFSFISFSTKSSIVPQLQTPLTGFSEFYDSSNSKYVYSAFLNNTDFIINPINSLTIQFEQVFAYQPIESSETLSYPRQAIRDTSTMVTFIQKVNRKIPKFGVVMDSYGCFDAYVYEAWLQNGRFVQTDGRKYEETYPYWSILGNYFYPITMQNNYESADHYVVIQLIPNDPDFPLELNSIRFDPYFEFSPSDASVVQDNLNRLIGLKFGDKDVVYPYLFVRPVNNELNVKLYTDYEIYRAFYAKPKPGVGLTYTLTQTGSYIPMLKDNQYGTEVGIATTKPVTISVFPNYKLVNGIPSSAKNLASQEQTYFAFDCRTFYDSVALNTNSKVYLRVIDSTTGNLIVNNFELDIRIVTSDGYVYNTLTKTVDNNMFVLDTDSISNIKGNCVVFDRFVQIRLKNLATTTKTFQLELSLVHVPKYNEPISISMNPSTFGYGYKDLSEILTREKNSGKSGIVLKQQFASYPIGKVYLSSSTKNIPPSFSDPSSIMTASSRVPDYIGSSNVIERLPISFKTNYGNFLFGYTHLITSQSISFSVENLPNTDISLSFDKGLTNLERLSNINTTIVNVKINGMDHYWRESLQKSLQQSDQEAFLYLKAFDQNNNVIVLRNYFSGINTLCTDSQLTFELVPIQGAILPSKFKLTFESASSLFTTAYDIPVLNSLQVDSGDDNNGIPSVECPERCISCDISNSTCLVCQGGYFGRNCTETCLITCNTCTNATSCETCPLGSFGIRCDIQDTQENPCSQLSETPIVSVSSSGGGYQLTYSIKIPKSLLSTTNQTVISHSSIDSCSKNQPSFQPEQLFECQAQYSLTTSISTLMNDSRIVKQLDSSGTVLTLNVPINIGLITNKFDSQNGDYCEIVNYGVNHQVKLVLSSHQMIGMDVNGNMTFGDNVNVNYRKEIITIQDGLFSLSGKLFTNNVTVVSVSYLGSQPYQNIDFDIILSEYQPNSYNLIISSKQKVSYISGIFTFSIQVRTGEKIVQVLLSISLSYIMPINPPPTELKYSTQVNLYSNNFGQPKNLFTISDSPHVLVNIVDSNGKSSSLPSSISLSIKNAYLCCTKSGVSMPTYDPSQNSYGCQRYNSTTMSNWLHLIDNQVVSSQYGTELIKFPLINFQLGFKFTIQSNMFPIGSSESVQVNTCFIHTESIMKSTSSNRELNLDESGTSIHNAFDIIQVFSAAQQKPPIQPSKTSPIISQSLRLNHSNPSRQYLSHLLVVFVAAMFIFL